MSNLDVETCGTTKAIQSTFRDGQDHLILIAWKPRSLSGVLNEVLVPKAVEISKAGDACAGPPPDFEPVFSTGRNQANRPSY